MSNSPKRWIRWSACLKTDCRLKYRPVETFTGCFRREIRADRVIYHSVQGNLNSSVLNKMPRDCTALPFDVDNLHEDKKF